MSYERWERLSAFRLWWGRIRAKCSLTAVISLLSSVAYGGEKEFTLKGAQGRLIPPPESDPWQNLSVKQAERKGTGISAF